MVIDIRHYRTPHGLSEETFLVCDECGANSLNTMDFYPKGKPGMNKTLAVFLISDSCRLIACAYEVDEKGNAKDGKTCSFKTFDPAIAKGDLVIVPTGTRVGFTVVKVIEVDTQGEINFDRDDGIDYKWIVGKFDRSLYDEGVAKERTLLEAVATAERNKKREEMRKALLENVPEDQKVALLGAPSAQS